MRTTIHELYLKILRGDYPDTDVGELYAEILDDLLVGLGLTFEINGLVFEIKNAGFPPGFKIVDNEGTNIVEDRDE